MKIIDIHINCGCGFVTNNLHDGLYHSVETSHQLGVSGSIDIKREVKLEEQVEDSN